MSMFYCPVCGRHLPGGQISVHRCPKKTLERVERDYRDHEEDEERVFTNCNVCGRKLHTADEDKMGMCEVCAAG